MAKITIIIAAKPTRVNPVFIAIIVLTLFIFSQEYSKMQAK